MTCLINFSDRRGLSGILLFSLLMFFKAGIAEGNGFTEELKRHALIIAVYPVENLTGRVAPLKEFGQLIKDELRKRGVDILDEDRLSSFMASHRVRYVAGIDTQTAVALGKETGVQAVLIISLELYNDIPPPKIAIRGRLVSVGRWPEILWMDSVSLTGDDSPGLFELSIVNDPLILMKKAVMRFVELLSKGLLEVSSNTGSEGIDRVKDENGAFSAQMMKKRRVIVMPFFNKSGRNYAGEIMRNHFIEQLTKKGWFSVVEPGVLREILLQFRIIMADGPSLADIRAIASVIDVDFVFSGTVFDYNDYSGPIGIPKVGFIVNVVDVSKEKMIYSSMGYRRGNYNVFLFDWGTIRTAHRLAAIMAEEVVDEFQESR